jgi:hypothetical protein
VTHGAAQTGVPPVAKEIVVCEKTDAADEIHSKTNRMYFFTRIYIYK